MVQHYPLIAQITGINEGSSGAENIFDKFKTIFSPPLPPPAGFAGGGIRSDIFNNQNILVQIVSRVLLYSIIIAGIIMFVKLLISGFTYLTAVGDPGKIQGATKDIINALTGLLVVLSSYFIIQIIQVVFGLSIL